MRRRIILVSSALLLLPLYMQAWGQDYQRAKDVLKALSVQETTLYQFPSLTSISVIKLPKNTPVYIYGKQGGFFDVRYQNVKGWGDFRAFIIQGTAAKEVPKLPKPVEITPVIKKPSNSKELLPIRLNPFISYSMEGKSFDSQIRAGALVTYATSNQLSVGAVMETVFINGTFLDFGPIVRHQWTRSSSFFNPAIYAGFLYYKFDHGSDNDQGFGIQTAFENDIPIMRNKSFQPSITMKIGTDMMFFYFDEVRIPVFISAGATFKF
jgi:hypothetical protein